MAETTQFELVSPERLFFSQPVEMVVVPGAEGDFAALPRHTPKLSTVRPGVIVAYENGQIHERIFVAGGFAEVTEESCTVMAEEAVIVGDLDEADAQSRFDLAKGAYDKAIQDKAMTDAVDLELSIATAMLAAAKGEFAYK
jgi:F-type H+-transporting ATPase subunit epsilon